MREYIEREAALIICEKEYQERLKMQDWCGDTVAWNIGHAIKAIQTADVVPVVRCSECVLSGNCTAEDTFRLVAGIENPFCCVGKRKDGEG